MLNILFIIDPLHALRMGHDTSFTIIEEAYNRGHTVWICFLEDLSMAGKVPYGSLKKIKPGPGQVPKIVDAEKRKLESMDVIFMRKDPPFNADYITTTYLLSLVNPQKTLVINDPAALRNFNEKLGILQFPEYAPDMLVTKRYMDLRAFLKKHKTIVLKPLEKSGGEEIVVVSKKDRNQNVLFEMLTLKQTRFILAQEYIPEVIKGDKRVLILDGAILGAINRIGAQNEHRSNLFAGGRAVKTKLTPAEQKMCTKIGAALLRQRIYFAGIDIIGGKLTEINITSPGTVPEMNELNKMMVERKIIDFVESKTSLRASAKQSPNKIVI